MGEDHGASDPKVGSQGYSAGTQGYPNDEEEPQASVPQPAEDHSAGDPDPSIYLSPREAARLMTPDQPVAHAGKAGWAVERATGRAVEMAGEIQWDVLMREPGAPRDEPGLTDVPGHGGLPAPGSADKAAHSMEPRRRKRAQIGLKLSLEQADLLNEAAAMFGVSRSTLARMLVVRGAREIVAAGASAKDSES